MGFIYGGPRFLQFGAQARRLSRLPRARPVPGSRSTPVGGRQGLGRSPAPALGPPVLCRAWSFDLVPELVVVECRRSRACLGLRGGHCCWCGAVPERTTPACTSGRSSPTCTSLSPSRGLGVACETARQSYHTRRLPTRNNGAAIGSPGSDTSTESSYEGERTCKVADPDEHWDIEARGRFFSWRITTGVIWNWTPLSRVRMRPRPILFLFAALSIALLAANQGSRSGLGDCGCGRGGPRSSPSLQGRTLLDQSNNRGCKKTLRNHKLMGQTAWRGDPPATTEDTKGLRALVHLDRKKFEGTGGQETVLFRGRLRPELAEPGAHARSEVFGAT